MALARNPAFKASPRSPPLTPATNADANPATNGRNGWQPGAAAQMAVAATRRMLPHALRRTRPMALNTGFQKQPRKQ